MIGEQIARITYMETLFDEITELLEKEVLPFEEEKKLCQKVTELEQYYTGPLWRKDFEDDRESRIPKDLKRGVLSEDGIWNILEDYDARRRHTKMNCLEERILKDGIVKEGNVLKVDSFLNHQMDILLFNEMGKEFKRRFADKPINKILTIEASGIGIACIVAQHFNVPVVFAKKAKSINLEGEMYVAEVESFTHKCKNNVIVAQKFLSKDDHVLIIDDFLANGCALQGLIQIVQMAGGTVEGIGIAIEKGFQPGGKMIRNLGYQLESLAIVDDMNWETGEIKLRQ